MPGATQVSPAIAQARAARTRPQPPLTIDELVPRTVQSDLDALIAAYLEGLSIPQLVCLAYGHRWPELIPGQGVPKGFHANATDEFVVAPSGRKQGIYRVTEDCIREIKLYGARRRGLFCETARTSMTLPRGFFDRAVNRQYAYNHDVWEVRPEDSRLTRRDFTAEIYRRMGRDLFPAEYELAP